MCQLCFATSRKRLQRWPWEGCKVDKQKLLHGRFCEVGSFRGRNRWNVQKLAKVLSRWWIPTNEIDLQLRESNGKSGMELLQ